MKRLLFGAGIALVAAVACADGYEDDLLTSSDGSVRRIVLPTGVVYAFTNTSGTVSCTLKTDAVISKTLVVAGGGAGGSGIGGGGGGGGVLYSTTSAEVSSGSEISLAVGAGGIGATYLNTTSGSDSWLLVGSGETITAKGGGRGGCWADGYQTGVAGGSGGGGTMNRNGGSGTSGQGCAGGNVNSNRPGGGGGATTAGGVSSTAVAGHGGEGLRCAITGEDRVYGSGGGGGKGGNGTIQPALSPGEGGTNAGNGGGGNAVDGFGGGGGGGTGGVSDVNLQRGGNGGSGTVIFEIMPKGKGVLFVAADADVPDAAVSTGFGGFVVPVGQEVTMQTVEDPVTKVNYVYGGYSVEEYDRQSGNWSSPAESADAVYRYAPEDKRSVRLTTHWTKTLGENALFRDRAIECTSRVTRKKVDGAYVYVFTKTDEDITVLLKADAVLKESLIVAGGGAGGAGMGAGGGGGGVVHSEDETTHCEGDVFLLHVGAGGNAGGLTATMPGENSWLDIGNGVVTAIGGGRGGSWATDYQTGGKGGSGGGGTMNRGGGSGTAGQGKTGADHNEGRPGGGGGAVTAGQKATTEHGGDGGEGLECWITGIGCVYGSGGAGGGGRNSTVTTTIMGGKGGTNAGDGGGKPGVDGFGGGGGGGNAGGTGGGDGGSGTVVLRLVPDIPQLGMAIILR